MADGEAAVRGRSGSQALAVNLTFNILASLRDYVILMNGSGHSIYTNKDITPLLRMKAPSLSGHVEPSQAEEVNLLQELECPELQADIRAMLKAGNDAQAPSSGTHHTVAHYSILCSDAHPDGLAIEYELSMPTIDQVRDGPRRQSSRVQSFMSVPVTRLVPAHAHHSQDVLQEYTEDKFAVLLVIRVPHGSVHEYLSGVVDAVGGLLLHLPPAGNNSNSSSSGAARVDGSSGGEETAPVADQVDLLRRSLDELLVTMSPRGPPRGPVAAATDDGHHNGVLVDLSGTPSLSDITTWEYDVCALTDKVRARSAPTSLLSSTPLVLTFRPCHLAFSNCHLSGGVDGGHVAASRRLGRRRRVGHQALGPQRLHPRPSRGVPGQPLPQPAPRHVRDALHVHAGPRLGRPAIPLPAAGNSSPY